MREQTINRELEKLISNLERNGNSQANENVLLSNQVEALGEDLTEAVNAKRDLQEELEKNTEYII